MRLLIIILFSAPFFGFSQENYKVELNDGLPILSLKLDGEVDDLDGSIDLYMVLENGYAPVQVSGKYWREGGWINYRPYTKLQEGFSFEARFYSKSDTNKIAFTIPKTDVSHVPLSEVLEIYPIEGVVPSNVLFFHVRFSEPMMQTPEAYNLVKVFVDDTTERTLPWRHKSFWLDDGRVLVLMVHPGRVKRGIDYLTELGVLFEEKEKYHIEVGIGLQDAMGRPLKNTFRKEFEFGAADRKSPQILFEEFKLPSKKRAYLEMRFSESMNYGSIIDGISLFGPSNNELSLRFDMISDSEVHVHLLEADWQKGKYKLVFSKVVSDLANNRLNRTFEVKDVSEKMKDTPVEWTFELK